MRGQATRRSGVGADAVRRPRGAEPRDKASCKKRIVPRFTGYTAEQSDLILGHLDPLAPGVDASEVLRWITYTAQQAVEFRTPPSAAGVRAELGRVKRASGKLLQGLDDLGPEAFGRIARGLGDFALLRSMQQAVRVLHDASEGAERFVSPWTKAHVALVNRSREICGLPALTADEEKALRRNRDGLRAGAGRPPNDALTYFCAQLQNTYVQATGRPPRRIHNAVNGRDSGNFLDFVGAAIGPTGLLGDDSAADLVRRVCAQRDVRAIKRSNPHR